MGTGEPRSVKFDIGFGTILDHSPLLADRRSPFAPALPSRVFLEPACPGHEPRTMRVFGRRHQPLSEIRSRDDVTLARSGASITEPLRVSVGPLLKAFGTAICQGNIHFSQTSLQFRSTRYGIDFDRDH